MASLVRTLSSFTKTEVKTLFDTSHTVLKKEGLIIRLAPRTKDFSRILIVIPKASGKAAQRNRIRRRIKSIFYEERLFERNQDCIVLVGRQAIALSFSDLKNLMLQAYSVS
jgi:ribonuclease P protein component